MESTWPRKLATFIVNDMMAARNKLDCELTEIFPKDIEGSLLWLGIGCGYWSGKDLIDMAYRWHGGEDFHNIIADEKYYSADDDVLDAILIEIIAEHRDKWKGDDKIINFFVGQIMKKLGKKTDMTILQTKVKEALINAHQG